jgi:hypothetical protein
LYVKPHSTGESKRRKLEELEERNLILDNKRLEEEIEKNQRRKGSVRNQEKGPYAGEAEASF